MAPLISTTLKAMIESDPILPWASSSKRIGHHRHWFLRKCRNRRNIGPIEAVWISSTPSPVRVLLDGIRRNWSPRYRTIHLLSRRRPIHGAPIPACPLPMRTINASVAPAVYLQSRMLDTLTRAHDSKDNPHRHGRQRSQIMVHWYRSDHPKSTRASILTEAGLLHR